MEGSREEVVRYIRAVVSVFQIPNERTSTEKLQDWAVNLARGGSNALAASGMMNVFRREGGWQVDTGTYDADNSSASGSRGWLFNDKCVAVWMNISFASLTRARRHLSSTGW